MPDVHGRTTPREALAKLRSGNARFAQSTVVQVDAGMARLAARLRKPPIAAVVCCSDPRVSPEIIFDAHLGELFAVRCAGGVLDEVGMASLRFAVTELGAPLVAALAHDDCAAVQAALAGEDGPDYEAVTGRIRDAVEANGAGDPDGSAEALARALAHGIASDPAIGRSVAEGSVGVVAGVYRLDSGLVEWLQTKSADLGRDNPPARPPGALG
jgi:carbonic anhydrase